MSTDNKPRTIVDAAHWRDASASEREHLAVSKFVTTAPGDLITKGVTLLNPDGSSGEPVERGVWFTCSTEVRDRDRDRISVDGWDLHNFLANPVVPWCHNYQAPPIGKARQVIVDRKSRRLRMLKEFAPAEAYPFADTIYRLTVLGFINTCSVGFIPKEYVEDEPQPGEDPSRHVGYYVTRQELLESSPVTVPSNPTALVEARSIHKVNLDPLVEWAEQLLSEHPQRGLWIPKKTLEQVVAVAGPQRSFHLVTGLSESPTPQTQTTQSKDVVGASPARCVLIDIAADVQTRAAEAPAAPVVPEVKAEPATQVAPSGDVPPQPVAEPISTPVAPAEPVVATPAPEAAEVRTVVAFTAEEIDAEITEVETKVKSYRPPKTVATSASHGLALAEQHKSKVGDSARGLAERLAARKACTGETIYRLASWFAAHAEDRKSAEWANDSAPSPIYLAWLHRGGDAGRAWSTAIKERLDAAEDRSMSITTETPATEQATTTEPNGTKQDTSATNTTIDAPRSEPAAPSVVVPAAPSGAVESAEVKAAEPKAVKAAGEDEEIDPAQVFAKGLALLAQAADEFFKLSIEAIGPAERIRAAGAVRVLEGALELLGIDDEDALGEEDDELYETEGRSAKRRRTKAKPSATEAQPVPSNAQATEPAPNTNPSDATKGVASATNTSPTMHPAAGELTPEARAELAAYVASLTRGTAN